MNGQQTWKGVIHICLETTVRLGIGGMFVYSAWGKLMDPGLFQTMVENYRILPASVTAVFSVTMASAELLVGLMLVLTKWAREAGLATAVFMTMFIVALGQAQIRGLDISCGCFSGDEGGKNDLLNALFRDVFLLVPAVWLLLKGQCRWIVDFRRIWYTERK